MRFVCKSKHTGGRQLLPKKSVLGQKDHEKAGMGEMREAQTRREKMPYSYTLQWRSRLNDVLLAGSALMTERMFLVGVSVSGGWVEKRLVLLGERLVRVVRRRRDVAVGGWRRRGGACPVALCGLVRLLLAELANVLRDNVGAVW